MQIRSFLSSGLSPYRTGAHRAHSEPPCPIPRDRAVYGQLNRAPTHHGTFPHQEAITDGCFNRRTLVLTAILQKRKKPAISPLDKLPLAQYNTLSSTTKAPPKWWCFFLLLVPFPPVSPLKCSPFPFVYFDGTFLPHLSFSTVINPLGLVS